MTPFANARRLFRMPHVSGALLLTLAAPLGAAPVDGLLIVGASPTPLQLGLADLAAMPRTSVSWTVHGKTVACEGPWLADVLTKAGAEGGEALRGPALARVVMASGADGYRVAFALGELDHALGNAPIIVADRCDGAALPTSDGPLRLVAAKEARGARSVRQLVRLEIAP